MLDDIALSDLNAMIPAIRGLVKKLVKIDEDLEWPDSSLDFSEERQDI